MGFNFRLTIQNEKLQIFEILKSRPWRKFMLMCTQGRLSYAQHCIPRVRVCISAKADRYSFGQESAVGGGAGRTPGEFRRSTFSVSIERVLATRGFSLTRKKPSTSVRIVPVTTKAKLNTLSTAPLGLYLVCILYQCDANKSPDVGVCACIVYVLF